jgi:hypothetical protein
MSELLRTAFVVVLMALASVVAEGQKAGFYESEPTAGEVR